MRRLIVILMTGATAGVVFFTLSVLEPVQQWLAEAKAKFDLPIYTPGGSPAPGSDSTDARGEDASETSGNPSDAPAPAPPANEQPAPPRRIEPPEPIRIAERDKSTRDANPPTAVASSSEGSTPTAAPPDASPSPPPEKTPAPTPPAEDPKADFSKLNQHLDAMNKALEQFNRKLEERYGGAKEK